MSILSLTFIVLYFISLVCYWIIPDRFRNLFLLLLSWSYLASWDWRFLLFLIGVILISWLSGKQMARGSGKRNAIVSVSLVALLSVLVLVKYTSMFAEVLGISFFTFQAISYVLDVYRGDTDEERNFVTYSLYVSFFPQLLSGPISKAKDQLARYRTEKYFDLEKMERGWILALYGCFLKLVIADRIAVFVNDVYANISGAGSVGIVAAILLYSLQIYCDFAGYSLIAIGLGQTYGIALPVNFRQPYLAVSINDFWKRWHISLTSWFRDYLYFSIGGNREGMLRTYLNIMVVFIVSGIWHGAGMTFIIWGALHGFLQIIERCALKEKKPGRAFVYLSVSILWVFFRSDNLHQASQMLGGIIWNNNMLSLSEILAHGLNSANLAVLMLSLVVMVAVDAMTYRGVDVVEKLDSLKTPVKWAILYALIASIIVFGVYGPGYDASRFIYYKF